MQLDEEEERKQTIRKGRSKSKALFMIATLLAAMPYRTLISSKAK